MKMKVERERIVILPENDQDIAYIEDMLGLKEEGETVPCKRAAMMGLSRSITCLEIRSKEENEESRKEIKNGYYRFVCWSKSTLSASA